MDKVKEALHNLRRESDDWHAINDHIAALEARVAELGEALRDANKGYVHELNRAESFKAKLAAAEALPAKWREGVALIRQYEVPQEVLDTFDQCADELDAALAQGAGHAG